MEEVSNMMPRGRLGLAREGYPFMGISLVLSAIGYWVYWPVGLAFTLAFLFCVYFFRDPKRVAPEDSRLLLSPADGTVLKVEDLEASPIYPQPHKKISVFMSALNVHVNRIPCDGVITDIKYHAGKFFVASLDKASLHNERNTVVMETPQNKRVAFTQIAGLVARRIVCYLEKGRTVRRGERYGLIRFGSRMEVSLPKEWTVLVEVGQKIQGVKTPLAKMSDS